jgi:ATP-dependent helicase HepA
MWKVGDRLTHRHNPELGIGQVIAVDARTVTAAFARAEAPLRLAATSSALQPIDLRPGRRVLVVSTNAESRIGAHLPDGRIRLADGTVADAGDLWPLDLSGELGERLAAGDFDPHPDFVTRVDALHLAGRREAKGLGSFLGGRIRLFPHQLHVAERATAADPVRWLLADEVGLGKTVEACLVLNRLVRTGRAERVLIVAPDTLTVQWLGELWRKHHQVLVLLDDPRLADVARDFGADFNPFDVHRHAVVAMETLVARPRLTDQAVAAGIDLLVVDEAHHLRRPPRQPGNAGWRAVAPIAALGRHVLLLTATPLEDDAHGFFRLLQLLRPEELPEDVDFEARLARAEPLPPCTSSTRRRDIGGLPPRVPRAIDLSAEAWAPQRAQEEAVRLEPAANAALRKRKADRVRRALASGAALAAVLGTDDAERKRAAEAADAADPRLVFLVAEAKEWKARGEKTFVFCAHRETLEMLRAALSQRAQLATAAFHEELSPARRDIEVAQFRRQEGASLLVSTECGGEGRNFEFCHRLVLYDLPWNPVVVEQRIGRLDRIGRGMPVEILYFRPPGGIGAEVVRLFEGLGLFQEPLAGLEAELAGVVPALEAAADRPDGGLAAGQFDSLVSHARQAMTRIREAAYSELHRDPYRPERAISILARVPDDLDALNQAVVTVACDRLGFRVEPQRGRRRFSIEFGNEALVDSLPGVPGGSSFLGTFDREEAVADETLDFFAAGHPLVEAVLAHLEEAPAGRVAALQIEAGSERGLGLAAFYKDGPAFEVVAVDARGRSRPEWAEAARRRPPGARWKPQELPEDWAETVRTMVAALPDERRPVALAALVVTPAR